jgi:hypothetical protein
MEKVLEELERQSSTLTDIGSELQHQSSLNEGQDSTLTDISNALHDIKILLEEISGKL